MNQEIRVAGMTCGHCTQAVTEEFTALEGVTAVSVDLVPGQVSTVRIESQAALDESSIVAALREAGDYTLA